MRKVMRGGTRIEPILYSQSGSAPNATWNTTMSFTDIVPSNTGAVGNYIALYSKSTQQSLPSTTTPTKILFNNTISGINLSSNSYPVPLGAVEDGVTLNINEYRVISFCLAHTNESNKIRLIDGTHTYLSYIMGVSRPRITRLYAVAKKKLLKAAVERGISLT
jgi:hypothetical protein